MQKQKREERKGKREGSNRFHRFPRYFYRTVAKVYHSEIVAWKVLNNRCRLYFTGEARQEEEGKKKKFVEWKLARVFDNNSELPLNRIKKSKDGREIETIAVQVKFLTPPRIEGYSRTICKKKNTVYRVRYTRGNLPLSPDRNKPSLRP